MAYEIQLKSSEPEVVDADGYLQEGVLTTFFQGRDGCAVLDSWAKRIASYRTRRHHTHPLDGPDRRAGRRSQHPDDHPTQGKLTGRCRSST
jgi:hypothetical protein